MISMPNNISFQGEQKLKIHLKDQYAPKCLITKGVVDNTVTFNVKKSKTEFSPPPELNDILKNTKCPGWAYNATDNNALEQAGPGNIVSNRSILDRINEWLTKGKLENISGTGEEKCSIFSNSNGDMAVIAASPLSPDMGSYVVDLVDISNKEYGNLITAQKIIASTQLLPEYNEIVNTAKKIIDLKV